MRAIAERAHGKVVAYHLPKGPPDETCVEQAIWCSGYVMFPPQPVDVPARNVCRACRTARKARP